MVRSTERGEGPHPGLQPLIPLHTRVSPIRSSIKNRSSSSRALVFQSSPLIWQEEIPGERRHGTRGEATTASGILGHLGAKTNGARHFLLTRG